MPSCKKLIVRGAGHFVLDDRVNLTEAIVYAEWDPLKIQKKKYDPIVDWKLPPDDEVKRVVEERVGPLRRLASPVFFSTCDEGKRHKGLAKIPSEGPILFVANHQLLGLDLGMIVAELLEERGITARGLAHPVIFQNSGEPTPRGVRSQDAGPFSSDLFQKFGAVMVTPRNYYRLLQTGQNALLFPGGVREVFHGKDEAYQLFWPEQVDFVRTAARFNATVIPISAVGAADSLNVLLDAPDVLKLPFGLGKRALEASANTTSARFNADEESELFLPPIVVPSQPARHYFMFGKPLKTNDLHHNDMDSCKEFYQAVQDELNRGFDDILRAREHDPYAEPVRRLAYERLLGKKAPTFSVSELNNNH
jgi:1-acyl-sn-glycerol-3-phosphate acyltransferase